MAGTARRLGLATNSAEREIYATALGGLLQFAPLVRRFHVALDPAAGDAAVTIAIDWLHEPTVVAQRSGFSGALLDVMNVVFVPGAPVVLEPKVVAERIIDVLVAAREHEVACTITGDAPPAGAKEGGAWTITWGAGDEFETISGPVLAELLRRALGTVCPSTTDHIPEFEPPPTVR